MLAVALSDANTRLRMHEMNSLCGRGMLVNHPEWDRAAACEPADAGTEQLLVNHKNWDRASRGNRNV